MHFISVKNGSTYRINTSNILTDSPAFICEHKIIVRTIGKISQAFENIEIKSLSSSFLCNAANNYEKKKNHRDDLGNPTWTLSLEIVGGHSHD